MGKGYIRKEFIETPNKVLCDFCEKEVSENKIRRQSNDILICLDCREAKRVWVEKQKQKLPGRTQFRYPNRPYVIRINVNKVEREDLNNIYRILGYNPEQDIHQQFLEKHNL